MRERRRSIVEAAGAVLVVASLAMIDVALGLLAAGLALILTANFSMGDDDARSSEERDR